MPRIRTIKPEFCVSAQVAECSKNARLLFVLMWMFCDDNGVHPANPKQLRMECFPGDDDMTAAVVTGLVNELLEQKLLTEYENNGQRFWLVSGWKHQRIDKPQPGKYPRYDDAGSVFVRGAFREQSASDTVPLPPDRKGEERKGEEGIGKEMKIFRRSIDETTTDGKLFWDKLKEVAKPMLPDVTRGRWRGVDRDLLFRVLYVGLQLDEDRLKVILAKVVKGKADDPPAWIGRCMISLCQDHGWNWDQLKKQCPPTPPPSRPAPNHHGGNHAEAESTAATVAAS